MAAALVAGCAGNRRKSSGPHVVVVGAGIVGASIAYHLALGGARVSVIDKEGPASHASRGTFAWINATWAKQPRDYHLLSQQGVTGWHRLESALNIPVRWGGSLEWFDNSERQSKLIKQIDEQVAWGEPARILDAAATRALEPTLRFPNDALAAFSPNDGAVDPVLATEWLLSAARNMGANTRFPCALADVVLSGGRLQAAETSSGRIRADRLVLATGAAPDIPKKFADIDIPQRSTPGVIAITQPMPRVMQRIIVAPGIHMHQRVDGRVVLGEQDGAPNNAAHAARLMDRPRRFPSRTLALAHAARMLKIGRRYVPPLRDATVDAVHIGWRPLPVDGHPVVGPSVARPDVYVAIMHSGVSLAPIVGELVAREIINNAPTSRLANYRPSRQFKNYRRY